MLPLSEREREREFHTVSWYKHASHTKGTYTPVLSGVFLSDLPSENSNKFGCNWFSAFQNRDKISTHSIVCVCVCVHTCGPYINVLLYTYMYVCVVMYIDVLLCIYVYVCLWVSCSVCVLCFFCSSAFIFCRALGVAISDTLSHGPRCDIWAEELMISFGMCVYVLVFLWLLFVCGVVQVLVTLY